MEFVDPRLLPKWDEMVGRLEGATIFHTAAWARVLAESYGCEPVYFREESPGGVAVLPMMHVRSIFTGRRGVSLPFTDAVAALGPADKARGMVEASLKFGRGRRWKTAEFRGGRPFGEDAKPSAGFLTHAIDLSASEDELFARLNSSTRRAVRKAQESGVRVETGSDRRAMRGFCRLNALTRREHGLPPQPALFFGALRRLVLDRGMGFVATATLGDKPVAASVFLHFGGSAVFKFGASDRRHQSVRAGNLVMWEGILACKGAGCRALSLGRTDLEHEGLIRFKRGWGGVESMLNYYAYDLDRCALTASQNRVSGFHNAIFKRLPLPLLRLAGEVMYRHAA
jgi:hypothetical protein